jgi:hypothetical protein
MPSGHGLRGFHSSEDDPKPKLRGPDRTASGSGLCAPIALCCRTRGAVTTSAAALCTASADVGISRGVLALSDTFGGKVNGRGGRAGEASVDIAAWLHGLGLQQYEATFRDNAITLRC